MQNKVNISQKIIGLKDDFKLDVSNIELLCILVHELSKELSINPQVQCIYEEKSMWIIFPDSCFECDFLIDNYALIIAAISEKYPIIINGIVNNFEEGELEIFYSEDKLKLNKRNVTCEDFSVLYDLYLKINIKENEDMEILNEVLSNIKYNKNCIAVKRKWDKYFLQNKINCNSKDIKYNMKYNYIKLEILENESYEYIDSLDISQMTELWLDFLLNHYTDLEFELLYDKFKNYNIKKIHLWELALRIALSKCGFSVKYENKEFSIRDKDGKHIRYNFESYSAAEKLMLKILFPVKTNLN